MDAQLALHRALVIARVAHVDVPTQWPELLPTLVWAMAPDSSLLAQVAANGCHESH